MSLKEFFLLSDARATAKRVPEDARRGIAHTLRLAERRAEAGERLWQNGHTAEGFRLLLDAFEVTKSALPAFVQATGARVDSSAAALESFGPVLRDRGLTDRHLRALLKVDRAIAGASRPVLDDEVTATDGELFSRLLTARERLGRALAPAASTPGELGMTRAWRISFFFAVVSAVAGVAYFVTRRPEGVTAVASDYTDVFDGPRIIDGDETTEWQLPDRTLGYVEITVEPPVRINTLRLLNGHNRWYNDRATRAYRIELFVGGEVARTIDGEFPRLVPEPEWVEQPVGLDAVERIRFNVRSYHRLGAGLAELEWN